MAAQFVAPFRKSRTSKNDRNDAEAIATAARQGNMRFVPVKDVDQQARPAWHRVREGYKAKALAIGNRLRGLLTEFGVVVAKSDVALRRVLADMEQHKALPGEFRELLRDLGAHWPQLHADRRDRRRRADHRRCDGRQRRQRTGVQERSTTGRVAGRGADPTFQRWTHAARHDQLSR